MSAKKKVKKPVVLSHVQKNEILRIQKDQLKKQEKTISHNRDVIMTLTKQVESQYKTGLKPDMKIIIGDKTYIFKEVKKPWWKIW